MEMIPGVQCLMLCDASAEASEATLLLAWIEGMSSFDWLSHSPTAVPCWAGASWHDVSHELQTRVEARRRIITF